MEKLRRDSQRKRVYTWEYQSFYEYRALSQEQCIKLIDTILSDYYIIGKPKLIIAPQTEESRSSFYRTEDNFLYIGNNSRYPSIVIHECAHVILWNYGEIICAPHGPEFMRLFLELLIKYFLYFEENPFPRAMEYSFATKNNILKHDIYPVANNLQLMSYFWYTATVKHRLKVSDDWWSDNRVREEFGCDQFDNDQDVWYNQKSRSEVDDFATISL